MTNTDKIQGKIPFLKIPSENPFEEDALGREKLCAKWTNFIEHSTTPYVMAIDGKWGTGKTALLKMWEADLKRKGFKCVFFDAWEADFYGQALPALIGEITKQIPNKNFTNKVKELSGALFTSGAAWKTASSLVKAVPYGETVAGASEALVKSLKDHDVVEHYRSYRKAVSDFKKSLQAFAEQPKKKPLVIFIDELDRCRPDFALEVLEKVKHVFDVESVFFVFAINKEEICKTINTVYGQVDGERYLRKFFDHTFLLINEGGLGDMAFAKSGLKSHLEERTQWVRNNSNRADDLHSFQEHWNAMCSNFDVSLRDEEQILSALNISFRAIALNHLTFASVLAYFAILKIVNPGLYEQCKVSLCSNGKVPFPYKEILDYYRDNANFGNVQNAEYAIPENDEDWTIYIRLCTIRYNGDEAYREKVGELAQSSDNLAESRFWQGVRQVAYTHFDVHIPENFKNFFETLDSIGGFSFDAEEES